MEVPRKLRFFPRSPGPPQAGLKTAKPPTMGPHKGGGVVLETRRWNPGHLPLVRGSIWKKKNCLGAGSKLTHTVSTGGGGVKGKKIHREIILSPKLMTYNGVEHQISHIR